MEHRAPARVQTPPPVVQQPAAEVWPDVEKRLLGFLRGRVFGAQRTSATPQSLNLQGLNWCAKNEAHLGEKARPDLMARMVGEAVTKALIPSQEEELLLETYGDRGEDIRTLNQGLAEMSDPRSRHLTWWLVVGVLSIVVAVGSFLNEQWEWGAASVIGGTVVLVIASVRGLKRSERISDGRWRY